LQIRNFVCFLLQSIFFLLHPSFALVLIYLSAFLFLMSFPHPLYITVGMAKGGTGKSFVATNLAAFLGRSYAVALLDLNPKANSYIDYTKVIERGGEPGFNAYADPTPVHSGTVREIESQGYDFVVLDTTQYRGHGETEWAWKQAHLFVGPICEERADFDEYANDIRAFADLTGGNRPIAIIPNRASVLHNSLLSKHFRSFLEELGSIGVYVPPPEFPLLDYNHRVKELPTRNLYAVIPGEKEPTEIFRAKFEVYANWLIGILSSTYGDLPTPRTTN
jgi:hypothetical protein